MSRSRSIEDIADEAKYLVSQFEKIASAPNIRLAFQLGYTLDIFRRTALVHEIDKHVSRQMLEASIFAHATATARLPAAFDRNVINSGMRAVFGLIVAWSESASHRKAREPAVYQDMRAHLRILCNCLHNSDLEDRVAERKEARIQQEINNFRRLAV
jgi:hypothetical protein